jgi:hypothetical protein
MINAKALKKPTLKEKWEENSNNGVQPYIFTIQNEIVSLIVKKSHYE